MNFSHHTTIRVLQLGDRHKKKKKKAVNGGRVWGNNTFFDNDLYIALRKLLLRLGM